MRNSASSFLKTGLISLAAASMLSSSLFATGNSVPTLSVNRDTANVNQQVWIRLTDADSNSTSDASTVTKTVTATSTGTGKSVDSLRDYNGSTGVYGSTTDPKTASLVFTTDSTLNADSTGSDKNATLYVSSSDTVTLAFTASDGDSVSKTLTVGYSDASFSGTTTKTYAKSLANQDTNVTVVLIDSDLNMQTDKNDSKRIKVYNSAGSSVNMILDETGANTGIFKGILHVGTDTVTNTVTGLGSTSGSTGFRDSNSTDSRNLAGTFDFDRNTTLSVSSSGDTLTIHYGTGVNPNTYAGMLVSSTDSNTTGYTMDQKADGTQTDVTYSVEVSIGSQGAVAISDSEISAGESITFTVTDDDLDTSSSSLQSISAGTASLPLSDGKAMLAITDSNGNLDYNVSVPLTETGMNTGVFTKTVKFSAIPYSNSAAGKYAEANTSAIPVESGSTITFTYADALDGDTDGTDNNVSTTATFATHTGTLSANKTTVNDKGQIILTLTDADLNTDSTSIQTYETNSTSNEANISVCTGTATYDKNSYTTSVCIGDGTQGQGLTLTETGVNTGIFTVEAFDVNVSGSGTPRTLNNTAPFDLNATDSSYRIITARYYDAVNAAGSAVTSSGSPATVSIAATEVAGTISLDASSYNVGAAITVTVTDDDLNRDATSIETYTASTSNAGTSPVRMESASSFTTSDTIDEVQVKLTETGVNTGIFTGAITLTAGTTSSSSQKLSASSGQEIVVFYNQDGDSTYTMADSSDVYAQADVISTTGTMELDKTVVNTKGDTVTITVTDADMNTNSSTVDTNNSQITVQSTSSSTGLTAITLTETGVDTGIFTGSFTTTNSASSSSIYVADGDAIAVVYADTTNASGSSATVTKSLTAVETLATVETPETVEEGGTFTITVTEPDGPSVSSSLTGTTSLAKDTISVKVYSTGETSDPIGFDLTLFETDVDSKIFTGTITAASSTVSGSKIKAVDGSSIVVRYTDYTDNDSGTAMSSGVGTKISNTVTVGAATDLATDAATDVSIMVGGTSEATFTGANTTLTATSSDDNITTASVSGSTVTLTAVNVGTATVSVTDGTDTITFNVTVTEQATTVSTPAITAGWNLIGNHSNKALTPTNFDAELGEGEQIWTFAASEEKWMSAAEITSIAPMEGLWYRSSVENTAGIELAMDGDGTGELTPNLDGVMWHLMVTAQMTALDAIKEAKAGTEVWSYTEANGWVGTSIDGTVEIEAGRGYWIK